MAVDSEDNIYVADYGNHLIRKITPGGVVTTFAGTAGQSGSTNTSDGSVKFNNPWGVAVDSNDDIFVTDYSGDQIRKIDHSTGEVTTFAGSGVEGSADGTGTDASFYGALGITVDSSDNIYVADYNNYLIRKITQGGVVTTLAGSGSFGSSNGELLEASFNRPFGIVVDSSNNIYVSESNNDLIRKIILP